MSCSGEKRSQRYHQVGGDMEPADTSKFKRGDLVVVVVVVGGD